MPRARCSTAPASAATARPARRAAPPSRPPVGAIWRGDTAAIARLSARYSPPMQLIGKLYRAQGGGWTADWIFVDSGKVLSKWTDQRQPTRAARWPPVPTAPPMRWSQKYAKRGTASRSGRAATRVLFTGMRQRRGLHAPVRPTCRACRWCAASRRCAPRRQRLELELELITGLPGFKRMVANGDVLAAPSEGEPPTFRPALMASYLRRSAIRRSPQLPAAAAMGADRARRVLAAVAAGADPDAVRVRRDARLARRSAGRSAASGRGWSRNTAVVLVFGAMALLRAAGAGAAGAADRAPDRHPGRLAAAGIATGSSAPRCRGWNAGPGWSCWPGSIRTA